MGAGGRGARVSWGERGDKRRAACGACGAAAPAVGGASASGWGGSRPSSGHRRRRRRARRRRRGGGGGWGALRARLANQAVARLGVGHHRGRGAAALDVGDDRGLAAPAGARRRGGGRRGRASVPLGSCSPIRCVAAPRRAAGASIHARRRRQCCCGPARPGRAAPGGAPGGGRAASGPRARGSHPRLSPAAPGGAGARRTPWPPPRSWWCPDQCPQPAARGARARRRGGGGQVARRRVVATGATDASRAARARARWWGRLARAGGGRAPSRHARSRRACGCAAPRAPARRGRPTRKRRARARAASWPAWRRRVCCGAVCVLCEGRCAVWRWSARVGVGARGAARSGTSGRLTEGRGPGRLSPLLALSSSCGAAAARGPHAHGLPTSTRVQHPRAPPPPRPPAAPTRFGPIGCRERSGCPSTPAAPPPPADRCRRAARGPGRHGAP